MAFHPSHSDKLPSRITTTPLWKEVAKEPKYAQAIEGIRHLATKLGARAADIVPDYTDHSVTHMDALWAVAGKVLTPEETIKFSPAEAFVLGASFYVHDLGMALAATSEGLKIVKATPEYEQNYLRAQTLAGVGKSAETTAVRLATRELHAKAVGNLTRNMLPGLDRYLIETTETRELWGGLIAEVSESHHWDLDRVERELGKKRPTLEGHSVDLMYLACCLRIIDYAHITHERVGTIDRALRSGISLESTVHWDAQAKISDVEREDDSLVFASVQPLDDVDAWWLFYDMACGLDQETRAVRDALSDRRFATGRFSLNGVKGVETPDAFRRRVTLPESVLPVDIRVLPDSMERLVSLLGGPELYGQDKLAPLRELLQNSRDSIGLARIREHRDQGAALAHTIRVRRFSTGAEDWLEVQDDGMGMSKLVITRHLVGVASQFWKSSEFFRDFPDAANEGFEPVGRFGIGFLSVFMLGDEVVVNTARPGGEEYELRLHGLGRRGVLRTKGTATWRGTRVRIRLKSESGPLFDELAKVVRARAPMLDIPIVVHQSASASPETIIPGWWKTASEDTLRAFRQGWNDLSLLGTSSPPRVRRHYREVPESMTTWPFDAPKSEGDDHRLVSNGNGHGSVLICGQGFAIRTVRTSDAVGLIDLGRVLLDASRTRILEEHDARGPEGTESQADLRITKVLAPAVSQGVGRLNEFGMLPLRVPMLKELSSVYGIEILTASSANWLSVLKKSGGIEQLSPLALRSLLMTSCQASIILCTTISEACGIASSLTVTRDESPTIVIMHREYRVNYSKKEELKKEDTPLPLKGSLTEVLATVDNSVESLVLLNATLEVIASAWSVDKSRLIDQEWQNDWDDLTLCARLEKSTT